MKRLKRLAAVSLLLFAIFSAMPVRPLAAQTLRVGVCADAPPYHFQDDNGRPTGMHMDFLNHIGYLKGYQMEYILFDRVTDAVVALEKGGVDMVLGALPDDVLNNSLVRFTDALSASPVCMITSVEREKILTGRISGMQPFSVAYELGTATLSQLSRFQMNHTSVVGSQQQVCGVLLANLSDTVVGIKQSLLYMLEEAGVRDRYVVLVDDIGEVEYRLLVRASDRALYGILNDAILTLRTSGAYSEMQAAWMVDLELQDIQGRMRIIVYSALVIFAVAGVIIVNDRYMNRRLKKLVEQKTWELNQKVKQLEIAGNLRNRLVEHSPGGNLLVSRDGGILLANSVALAMAGAQEESPPARVQDMQVFSQIWEKAEPYFEKQMDAPELIVLNTGAREKHTYRYQCHRTSTGEEMVLLVEDVTWEERRKQDVFEERKNQTLNRMIAGVAHEIKNPLMSIRTFASLITAQGDDPEFQTAFQEYVPKEVDRISRLIETLINYARPPRERKELLQVSELVRDCMSLAYLSSKKNIPVECDVPENVAVYANGDQLRQALVNLLVNAIEAVETRMNLEGEPGEEPLCVRVSGYREADRFVLEIFDRGSGMSEEDILQCTDPFFTTKKSGVGMGLALTKQYVRENDGRLEIESVLGQFTKMRMILKEETGYEAHRMDH